MAEQPPKANEILNELCEEFPDAEMIQIRQQLNAEDFENQKSKQL
ncbi:MAG TPA: hypothetical protein VFN56_01750 [Candidatus Saccharimonadales bacterium]|nr:hypothetical protein [Candidatus Saccharimonadales bacterium]